MRMKALELLERLDAREPPVPTRPEPTMPDAERMEKTLNLLIEFGLLDSLPPLRRRLWRGRCDVEVDQVSPWIWRIARPPFGVEQGRDRLLGDA
jgi:hypothetical protein